MESMSIDSMHIDLCIFPVGVVCAGYFIINTSSHNMLSLIMFLELLSSPLMATITMTAVMVVIV